MEGKIRTIRLGLPFRMGSVNCYLVETDAGYILVDTGGSDRRSELERELAHAGCRPGDLKLIALTHGDFDHIGNAVYLRGKYGARIAMHEGDTGMAERGDMSWNRKKGKLLLKWLAPLFFPLDGADRFTPDLTLEEGSDLSGYGFDAEVLHLPGHSKGSIGFLTAAGDLICGDLLDNTGTPGFNSIMDDLDAAEASLEKLRNREINLVYPGHGEPFPMDRLLRDYIPVG
jgi:glyoxylase-like metal-dependent hydrolase (beta-lactamase superfamily II)